MSQPTRRRFLCASAGALAFAASRWSDALTGQERRLTANEPGWEAVAKTSWALGTQVSMTALHRDPATAQRALEAAFAELERVEELMSIYRPHSQISRLNREGALDNPDPDLVRVLHYAQALAEQTGGAFDATVQPLWEVYQKAKQQGALPSGEEIAAARRRVGWRRLEVTPRRIALRAGAAITLNGVAQGFAADQALRTLRSCGVKHALVDVGELGALGPRSGGQPWVVGIQHPRRADAYIALAKLAGRCLATSGDYETAFSPDYVHHHLFDPRTGRSPQELASVTIAARTAMEADALSTAAFILGPQAGAELVRRTPGADALLVLKEGKVLATEGFPLENV